VQINMDGWMDGSLQYYNNAESKTTVPYDSVAEKVKAKMASKLCFVQINHNTIKSAVDKVQSSGS